MIDWQPGVIREPVERCKNDHTGGFDLPGCVGRKVRVRPPSNVVDALDCELEVHPEDALRLRGYEPEQGVVLCVCGQSVVTD